MILMVIIFVLPFFGLNIISQLIQPVFSALTRMLIGA
jgi:hypothetical protein